MLRAYFRKKDPHAQAAARRSPGGRHRRSRRKEKLTDAQAGLINKGLELGLGEAQLMDLLQARQIIGPAAMWVADLSEAECTAAMDAAPWK